MYTMMFIYLLSSVIYISIGLFTYFNNKKSPLNQTFLGLCLLLFFWSFCLALMSASHDVKVATFFRVLSVFSWSSLYSLLLLFIIFLTENNKCFKKKWHYITLFIPTFICIYLYVLDPVSTENMVKINIGWAFLNPSDKSFLWDVFFNFYYSIYMLFTLFLLVSWYKKTNLKRQKKQSKIIFSSMILTFVFGSIADVVFPLLGLEFLPPISVFLALSVIIAIAYCMRKYSLMLVTNEKVVSDVFKIMNEGLIILNHDYSINGINQGALRMLGYRESDLLYKSIKNLFEDVNILDSFGHTSSEEFEIRKKNGDYLPVLISTSILLDNFSQRLGNILIFQDLSNYKKIQNELKEAYEDLELKVKDRTYQLTQANNQLEMEIDMRIEKEERIRDLAYNDQLTGLPNRKSFNKILEKAIKNSKKNANVFAVLFLDLDGFKMINDTLGHDQGDFLLEKVAMRLNILLGEDDYLARVGGDEFIILINKVTSVDDIKSVCDMIIKSFNYPFSLTIGDIYTTTSIGIALYPNDGIDSKMIIKNADIAMYKSKESGKGKYKFYNSGMLKNLDITLRLTNDLHRAIEQGELEVYYQPQNDTFTHKIRGVEALVRWNHPLYGIVNPDIFIPIAEHTGLILEIGEWVLDQSCKDFNDLRKISSDITSIGVNLSVSQIISHRLVNQVKNVLDKNGVSAKHLELEITESFLLNDTKHILKILDELKSIKVRIAVDDFGTDYSSLRYLKQLPLNRIKIAKNFIDGIGKSSTDEAIIAAIIFLGEKLKLNLIAEGVENGEQLEFLKNLACQEIQGFYFHKPMRFSELKHLLSKDMNEKDDILIN